MNKFNFLIESVLEEAKIDDFIKKAKLDEQQEALARTVYAEIGRLPKFVEFIVKNITFGSRQELVGMIEFFKTNVTRLDEKDINKYTFQTLRAQMIALGDSKTKIKQEISKDAPIVWESPDGKIVVRNIQTWEASKKYGAGTRWCITEGTDTYWKSYYVFGLKNFYFVHFTQKSKDDPLYKLAVVVDAGGNINSIYNAPDSNIIADAKKLLEDNKVPFNIFKPQDMSKYTIKELIQKCCNPSTSELRFNDEDNTWNFYGKGSINIKPFLVQDGKLKIKFKKIEGSFYILDCRLTSLEGCPEEVTGDFYCYRNDLESLKGCPTKVGGNFNCQSNKITSLEGSPEFDNIDCNFSCSINELKSMKGCNVNHCRGFDIRGNHLTSLEGCPKIVSGTFTIDSIFTKEEVEKVCTFGEFNNMGRGYIR